ncbi:MAG TPA: NfeD family protein, partial [Anaerohalosphaeraceae bacterium]|nr:NfeD family protein [Anaerohalosphaeraceae bacterium]
KLMFWWLFLAIVLYILCAVLLVAEVFVPSGGLLSICALACAAGGGVIFFRISSTAGWIGVIIAMFLIPGVLVLAYKLLPKTRFGHSVMLTPPNRQQGDAIPDKSLLDKLTGRQGKTVTPLRPVGTCDFDGLRVQCTAECGFIDKNEPVRVLFVEGMRVVVAVNK